jgi:hypothetical protein
LITKTFPRRRTTTDPGLRFSDLIELRTFMADSFRPEALKLDILLNTISITIIPAVPGRRGGAAGRRIPQRPAGWNARPGDRACMVAALAPHRITERADSGWVVATATARTYGAAAWP